MTPAGPSGLEAVFATAMDRLGPFEAQPRLALAVSGGADSMAIALLARKWAGRRGGNVHAFVVDHGLRMESAAEAAVTVERLAQLSVPATLVPLTGLAGGAALAARARIARYQALTSACRHAGHLHLLLGHHAADQAETLAMRALRHSGSFGLAGMPGLSETRDLRLLRPLLAVPPDVLRAYLRSHGVAWVEDPSNRNLAALRPRLRAGLAGADLATLGTAARTAGAARAHAEAAIAAELATRATIRPEGLVLLQSGRISPSALGAVLQMVAGSAYPPAGAQVRDIAANLRPATIAGVRLVSHAGGVMLIREEAAMAPSGPATPGMRWDGRMRLTGSPAQLTDATVDPLGDDAARFRLRSDLPAAALRTLPALRRDKILLAVPHLGYVSDQELMGVTFLFDPPRPAAGPLFLPI